MKGSNVGIKYGLKNTTGKKINKIKIKAYLKDKDDIEFMKA